MLRLLPNSIARTSFTPIHRTYVAQKVLRPSKFKSILADVPTRPVSGWQVYLREHTDEVKKADPKLLMTDVTKQLAAKWKALPESEKEVYNEKYRKESQAHYDAYDKALQNATSQQIYEENILRRKYKLPVLKDPKAPKRPYMNGFMYYLQELRQVDTRFGSLSPKEQAREGARLYRELSDAEKKPYNDKAEQHIKEYRAAREEFESKLQKKTLRELVPTPPKKPAKKSTKSTTKSAKTKA